MKGDFQMELTKAIKDIDTINEILAVYPKYSKNYLLIYYLLNTGLRISDTLEARVSDRNGLRGLREQKDGETKRTAYKRSFGRKNQHVCPEKRFVGYGLHLFQRARPKRSH